MRYAVRLGDLMQDTMLGVLIGPVATRETVKLDKRAVDGPAVVLTCSEEQALAIRDVCRLAQERKRIRLVPRFYQQAQPGRAWRPMP